MRRRQLAEAAAAQICIRFLARGYGTIDSPMSCQLYHPCIAAQVILAMLVVHAASAAPPEQQRQNKADEFALLPSSTEPSLLTSDDLELDLVLREPVVEKPLYMTFDERGRLWVVQYRQYPSPAGLKLLSRDSVWRNVYDPPFPPPPPHAVDSPFRGQDRITIHEDFDGDGSFDRSKTFLDGLNLATAALPGRGGVFVLNPPYLLFYADRDRDDVPDSSQPELLLSGFGIEDSHSIANSLRWGPDGWIYATQGSTVGSSVVTYDEQGRPKAGEPIVHSMGQNVWRYHPEGRRYEIFAEGGGNAFGVEIDQHGRIYSGHNGGDTRGFHYVQGGYWQKTFGKHGQLSNPYAFDFHAPMRHPAVQRFTHTFCIYEADRLPRRYHGALFGINPIEHHVVVSRIEADGSSWRTEDRGLIVRAADGAPTNWFTPVDVQLGPDGAVYLADWHAEQAAHFRNHEGKTNPGVGRIYRLRGRPYEPGPAFDLSALSSANLVERYLGHPNRWHRQQARRVLADRRDSTVVPKLWELVSERTGQDALEALWALHVSGGLDQSQIAACLQHENPHVRRWCVQLLGDRPDAVGSVERELAQLAQHEPDVEVRCQLAATCKRLPSRLAVPLVFALLEHKEDADDVYLPKTLWWSLEAHAGDADCILRELAAAEPWRSSFRVAGFSMPQNLMRRYALAGRQEDLAVCARLLQAAPDAERRDELVEAFVRSFAGRSLPALPDALSLELARGEGPFAELLAIRRRDEAAVAKACKSLIDGKVDVDHRIALIQALGDVQAAPEIAIPVLIGLLSSEDRPALKTAALLALQKYPAPHVGELLADLCEQLPAESQPVAVQALTSRREWAGALLNAVRDGRIAKELVDADNVARLRRHADEALQQQLSELFPATATTLSQLEARIESLADVVRQGQGSPLAGRELFHGKASCGKCHRLFHAGGEIGPDLTPYNRSELSRMLLALVNPSAEVREGYEVFTALTDDGRVLSGFKIDESNKLLVLRGSDGQNQTIPKSEVEEIIPNAQSLMPEGLLDSLTDAEIRDLFAYLSSTTPPM